MKKGTLLFAFFLIILSTINVFAQDFKFRPDASSRISRAVDIIATGNPGTQYNDVLHTTEHNRWQEMQSNASWNNLFGFKSVANYVKVGIDHTNKHIVGNYKYKFVFRIEGYSNPATPTTAETKYVELLLEYNKDSMEVYKDQTVFRLDGSGYHAFRTTLVSVYDVSGSSPAVVDKQNLADNFYVETIIEAQFYDKPNPAVKNVITAAYNSSTQELALAWAIPGSYASKIKPVRYELEWTFVDDYKLTNQATGAYTTTFNAGNLQIPYVFKNNATRVILDQPNYKIPMIYEHGALIYRLRMVRPSPSDFETLEYSDWTLPESGTITNSYLSSAGMVMQNCLFLVNQAHQEDQFNWQYTISFAEEGKYKHVLNYFDGSGKNRQTLTKVNTDSAYIVAMDNIYDYEWRPAIKTLPIPVLKNNLRYIPDLSLNSQTNQPYKAADFDEGCLSGPLAPFASTALANTYYSSLNPDKSGMQKYVPEANGYPFVETIYSPDNTNKVLWQGGAGLAFQRFKNHGTQYAYVRADQPELNQLLGSEAGYAMYYPKQVTVDPNGQISYSIFDADGKVVLTGLAGTAPDNDSIPIEALTTQPSASSKTYDMYNGDKSTIDNGSLISQNSFYIEAGGLNKFKYEVTTNSFPTLCAGKFLNVKAKYKHSVLNDCGEKVMAFEQVDSVGTTGIFNSNQPTPKVMPEVSASLNPGKYTLVKELSFSDSEAKGIVSQFVDEHTAFNDCYNDQNYFIRNSVSQTQFPCEGYQDPTVNTNASCDTWKERMKAELYPGAKYGKYTANANGTYASSPANSIFSTITESPGYYCVYATYTLRFVRTVFTGNPAPGSSSGSTGGFYEQHYNGGNYSSYDEYEKVPGQPYYTTNPAMGLNTKIPGTELRIGSAATCYGNSSPSYTYRRYQAQCIPFTAVFLPGSNTATTLSAMTPDQLILAFNNQIAEALLPLHPEYCKLRLCDNGFADKLSKITSYAQAQSLGLHNLAGILGQDPLSQINAPAAPFSANQLSFFYTQQANAANATNPDNKVDRVALKFAYCGSNSGEQSRYCAAVEYLTAINNLQIATDVQDVYFSKLKELYLSNRSYLIQKAMDGTLTCGTCFGARLNLEAPSVVPSVFDITGYINNPDIPADIAAALNGYLASPEADDPYGAGTMNPNTTPTNVTSRYNQNTTNDCNQQIENILKSLENCGLTTTQKDNIRTALRQQSCNLGFSGAVITPAMVRTALVNSSVPLSDLCQPYLAAYKLPDTDALKDRSKYISKNAKFYSGIQSFLGRSNVMSALHAAVANNGSSTAFTLVLDQNNFFEKDLATQLNSGTNAITVQCTYVPPASNVNLNPVLRINVNYGANTDVLYLTNRKTTGALPYGYNDYLYLGSSGGSSPFGPNYVFDRVSSVIDDPEYLSLSEGKVASKLAFLNLRGPMQLNGGVVEYPRAYFNIWAQKLQMLRVPEENSSEGCVSCEILRRATASYYAQTSAWYLPLNAAHPFYKQSLTNFINNQLNKQHSAEEYENLAKGCALSNQLVVPSSAATMSATFNNLTIAENIKSELKTNPVSKDINIPNFTFINPGGSATVWWDFGAVPYGKQQQIRGLIATLWPTATYLPATSTAELFVQSGCAAAFQSIPGATVTMEDVNVVNLVSDTVSYKRIKVQATASTALAIANVVASVKSMVETSTCGIAKAVYGNELYRSADYATFGKQDYLNFIYGMSALTADDIQDATTGAKLMTAVPILTVGGKIVNYTDPWCAKSKYHIYYYKPLQAGNAGYDRLNTVLENVKTALSNKLFLNAGSQSINHSFGANGALKIHRMANGTMYYQLFDAQNRLYNVYLRPSEKMVGLPSTYTAYSATPILTGGTDSIFNFKLSLQSGAQTVECFGYTDFPIGVGYKLENVVLKSDPNNASCTDTLTCEREVLVNAVQQGISMHKQYIAEIKSNMLTQMKNYLCANTTEKMWHTMMSQQYHYTLYYYDLAGNLTRTVPPQGIQALAAAQSAQVDAARSSTNATTNLTYKPAHNKATQYRYNAHNQVVWQQTPDAGVTKFYYDYAGRLLFSQNQQQATADLFSYTIYDGQSRIEEVGVIGMTPELQAAILDKTSDAIIILPNGGFPGKWSDFIRGYARKEVVYTKYDQEMLNLDAKPLMSRQKNLRKRVSAIAYTPEVAPAGDALSGYQYATHFSYDAMGNVQTLTHDNPYLGYMNQRYKRIDYDYDLLSGKVNMLSYNRGQADQFYQRYEYDADNRITTALSSKDGLLWDKDATYSYYKHGPLAEMQVGDLKTQSVQYAYTIQGWLKAINGDVLNPAEDMGKDGYSTNPSDPANIYPADLMAHSLDYHKEDYQPIDATSPVIHSATVSKSLYNGNIARQTTAITGMPNMMRDYTYDQLNRITAAQYSLYDNVSHAISSMGEAYKNSYTYDADGNILTLTRKNKDGVMIDNFTYHYYAPNANNKLSHVVDAAADISGGNDLKQGQQAGNYVYDAIGNLIEDKRDGLRKIRWSNYGKMLSLSKGSATVDSARLSFFYDGTGNRVRKDYYSDVANSLDQRRSGDVYVRDAQGNILAVYKHNAFIDGMATISGINNSMISGGISASSLGNFFGQQFGNTGTFVNSILDYAINTGSPATNAFVSSQLSPHPIVYYYLNSRTDYEEMLSWLPSAYEDMVAADWTLLGNPLSGPGPEAHEFAGTVMRTLMEGLDPHEYEQVMAHMARPQSEDLATRFCTEAGSSYPATASFPDRVQELVNVVQAAGPNGFGEFYNAAARQSDPLPFLEALLNDPALFNRDRLRQNDNLRNAMIQALLNADYAYQEADVSYMYNWLAMNEPNWLNDHMTMPKMMAILFRQNPSQFMGSFIQQLGIDPVSTAIGQVNPMSIYAYYDLLGIAANNGTLPYGVTYILAGTSPAILQDTVYLAEHHLYGSSRLGVKSYKDDQYRVVYDVAQQNLNDGLSSPNDWFSLNLEEMIKKNEKNATMANRLTDTLRSSRWLGAKNYELTDHLGNVIVSFLDRKTGYGNNSGQYTGYKADVVSTTDYYPFGFEMQDRAKSGYRFGFNGKENVNEIYGNGNFQDYGMRDYDPRIARLNLRVDPLTKEYPWYTPYQFAGNTPIQAIDLDGAEPESVIQAFYTYGVMTIKPERDDPNGKVQQVKVRSVSFKYTEAAAHLLSLVSGVSVADIKKVNIKNASGTLTPAPFGNYRPSNGGGAMTLPNGNNYDINMTDNFFTVDGDATNYGRYNYGNDPYRWLSLSSHEVGHIVDIKEIGRNTEKYMATFLAGYVKNRSHDGYWRESRADKGRTEFWNFTAFVDSYYGKGKLIALFENKNNSSAAIIQRLNTWWGQYQKQKTKDGSSKCLPEKDPVR